MQSKEGREIWSQTRGTSAQPRPMPVTGGERPDRQKVVFRETGWSGHPSACAGGCHRAGMWACPATHIPSKKSLKSRFEHGILQFLNVGNDLKHFPKHSVGQTKHVCRPGGSVRSRARHRPALCSPRHTGPARHHATPGSAPKRRGRCALASRIAHCASRATLLAGAALPASACGRKLGGRRASPHRFPFCTHARSALGAHFLFGELSLWVTQGLRLQGCSRRGSPRLRWTLSPDDWPWLALPGRPEPLTLSSSRTRPRQESSSRSSARHGGVVHPDGPCHTALPLASSSDDSFPSLRNLFQESTEVTLDTLRALGMESLPFQAAFFV